MSNIDRLKAMRRLYYYKNNAVKNGDMAEAHRIEVELDSLRIQKKDDPKYRHEMNRRKLARQRYYYNIQLTSGYFKKHARKYRRQHPERMRKASHKWYLKVKSDPKRYAHYLKVRRHNQRLLRRKKAIKHV